MPYVVADSEKAHTIDQVITKATTCYVSASEPESFTRSTFCGERKLLHILEDIIQPRTEQEGDTDVIGNDDHDRTRKEVARYTGDDDLIDSWNDHGPLEWWWAKSSNRYPCLAQLA